MRKINDKKDWKVKSKRGFHFYFVLFASIVILITSFLSDFLRNQIEGLIDEYIKIPSFIILIITSLIIGGVLSHFTGKILLSPIKNLRNLMNEVANGNLDVCVEEKSNVDEVEDMYHYFNLMMKELKATETIQSDFVSNVSHEIKTPLNAIEGYATLLSDKDISDEEKEIYLKKILYNTNRMNELISNILLLSKVDNQAIETKKVKYSLDEQIRQSIVFLEPKWNVKKIDFNVELETINYYGNSSLMMHVWNNLIDNAIKFSPENSIINIYLKKQNEKIIFIIEDSGKGIKEENKKHIFNKFFQEDSSRKAEGNGLGLSLVKKILDLSRGTIEVENIIPTGCRFIVTL